MSNTTQNKKLENENDQTDTCCSQMKEKFGGSDGTFDMNNCMDTMKSKFGEMMGSKTSSKDLEVSNCGC